MVNEQKVPYQSNGKRARSDKPNTWTTFRTVCKQRESLWGIGFMFREKDPYTGIDLDGCLDENGKLKAWTEPIVRRLECVAYGEVSPSGKGIKFWTEGKIPANVGHKVFINAEGQAVKSDETGGAIEIYDRGRYFTVTGRGKGEIRNGQGVINWLYKNDLTKPKISQYLPRAVPSSNLTTTEKFINQQAERR